MRAPHDALTSPASAGGGAHTLAPPPPPTSVRTTGSPHIETRDLSFDATRVTTRYERFVKPVLDRLGGVVLLALALPALTVIALAVALTLGRPVLLRQQRVQRGGATFGMLKFRTMQPCRRSGRDRRGGPRPGTSERRQTHKHPNDPRMSRLGKVLRRWSLDELPQLWHVVTGEMSLVGPRPELSKIVAHYEPWQHHRHVAKPGLTGLWQITERARDPIMYHHVDVDLSYCRRITFRGDLKILLHTVPATLGRGSGV